MQRSENIKEANSRSEFGSLNLLAGENTQNNVENLKKTQIVTEEHEIKDKVNRNSEDESESPESSEENRKTKRRSPWLPVQMWCPPKFSSDESKRAKKHCFCLRFGRHARKRQLDKKKLDKAGQDKVNRNSEENSESPET